MSTKEKSEFVIVVTKSRPWSIVAGTLVSREGDEAELRDARMICYFDTSARTIYGLAERGPGKGRVSPAVARARVSNVEHVLVCSDAARKAIEAEPWF